MSRAVLFYDQLGCGRSDRPLDNGLWSLDRFVDELSEILAALKVEKYWLFGHSCGSMIALEHALTRPDGLAGLIFASPVFSVSTFIRDINLFRALLSPYRQSVLAEGERAGVFTSPEFIDATKALYEICVCRLVPWPVEYARAAEGMGQEVYRAMWGPTEFICTGNLKSYERASRLTEIDVPTLLTGGRWDSVVPETLNYYHGLISASRVAVFKNSAHMAHLEESEAYLRAVGSFLDGR